VLDELRQEFPKLGPSWTAGAPLPGGELFPPGIERFVERAGKLWPFLPPDVTAGYAHRYGMRMHQLLGNISTLAGLGPELTPGLYEREAVFLVREEWARSAADILWRRTKLGLRATQDDAQALADWLRSRAGSAATG
jgi:glycerol-3-phosphate dehydrogenase